MRALLLTVLLAVFRALSVAAPSEAEKYVPADLDPQSQYQTYSFDEFSNIVDETAGISNKFVGRKVKVFGIYDVIAAKQYINRSRRAYLSSFGCVLDLCDFMEPIVTHDVSRSFDKFTGAAITVYFPDKNQYKLFLKESEQLCPPSYPCKIWAKGIARYVDTETVTLLGRQKLRIGFVAADEIRLYEGKTHALVDGASLGLKTFMKIYPMLPKSEK